MLGYLLGQVKIIDEKSVTILTSSGVGYKVFAPLNTLLAFLPEQEIELLIKTVVKDDAIDLYGFENQSELLVFERLITVSGVGPRSALSILSSTSVADIAEATENNDLSLLTRIPGIGKRTCEKIILELKGKLTQFLNQDKLTNNLQEENDARLALSTLGYSDKDISNTLQKLKIEKGEEFMTLKTNEIIKWSLRLLR